jgi:shikimate dehydrogenase
MKRCFGLTGFPLGHSLSPAYFQQKFDIQGLADHSYELFPLHSIHELQDLLKSRPDLCGLNVTVPYKQQILPFLDELDPVARDTGAVNTVRIERSENKTKLTGFNSDVYGFRESLKPLLSKEINQAIVLGNGGAAKAVKYVLNELSIPFLTVSRKPDEKDTISWANLNPDLVSEHNLIIQCTPVGLHPDDPLLPFPFDALSGGHLVYDLIYNPVKTNFLEKSEQAGARIKNGYEMLCLQADEAWRIWNI